MGTSYNITLKLSKLTEMDGLKSGIDSVLTAVNHQMSTYDPESEISHFNRMKSGDTLVISSGFAHVVKLSKHFWELTDGAFDVTVYPLIKLWGFGPESNAFWEPPSPAQVQETRSKIGLQFVELDGQNLTKTRNNISMDLNAIAKGYGVDQVSRYLDLKNIKQYFVEIGGEVRCLGKDKFGEDWSIGIDRPTDGSLPGENLESVIQISKGSVATSGDYRAFHLYAGKRYSHAIDPHSGYPSESNVASATVVAENCASADALATALMILGEEPGIRLINAHPGLEALLIIRAGTDQFRVRTSTGMKELLR